MLISNEDILSKIKYYVLDSAINELDPSLIENDVVKIIVRTIQQSKQILVNTLEDMTSTPFGE